MRQIENEDLCVVLKAKRKGKGKGGNNTELEVGLAVLLDKNGNDTNQVVIRIEELATGIPPVVAVIEAAEANKCFEGLFRILSRTDKTKEEKEGN